MEEIEKLGFGNPPIQDWKNIVGEESLEDVAMEAWPCARTRALQFATTICQIYTSSPTPPYTKPLKPKGNPVKTILGGSLYGEFPDGPLQAVEQIGYCRVLMD